MKPYLITEHISWDKRIEFEFKGFKQLAIKLRAYHSLMKLHRDKEYKITIEEVA